MPQLCFQFSSQYLIQIILLAGRPGGLRFSRPLPIALVRSNPALVDVRYGVRLPEHRRCPFGIIDAPEISVFGKPGRTLALVL
jgi:hypothetical protein